MAVKVAMLQDLQVPKKDVERCFAKHGLTPLWPPFATPTDARAIATDGRGQVTAADLDLHPRCRVLAVAFVGCNHVDQEACGRRGIAIMNCPDYSSAAVAELTIGLALAVYREIPASERTLRAGGWEHLTAGMELRGKVIGIVGLGNIGMQTATMFHAFGPKELLGWSRREKPAFAVPPLNGKQTTLEDIFDRADIVCISVLLTEETKGMITRALMERLRPSSVLINIARSALCDEGAMVELLCQRRFRAALDVYPEDPLPADDPIRSIPADQVVLVPHIGYKTSEALQRRLLLETENLKSYFAGEAKNVIQQAPDAAKAAQAAGA